MSPIPTPESIAYPTDCQPAYGRIRDFLESRALTIYTLPFYVEVVTQTSRVARVLGVALAPNPRAIMSDTKTLPRLVIEGLDGEPVELGAGEIDATQFMLVANALAHYAAAPAQRFSW